MAALRPALLHGADAKHRPCDNPGVIRRPSVADDDPGVSRPSTHLLFAGKTWMPGRRPGMTTERPCVNSTGTRRSEPVISSRSRPRHARTDGLRCLKHGNIL